MMWFSFVRPQIVVGGWRLAGWLVVAVFWGLGVWRGLRDRTVENTSVRAPDQQDLFIRAQTEYLRGHWLEAQQVLEHLLRGHPRDVESHLLLASVYRRSRRIDLSHRQLQRAQGLEGAHRWQLELARERRILKVIAQATGIDEAADSSKTEDLPQAS
jgi:hypothetical protein